MFLFEGQVSETEWGTIKQATGKDKICPVQTPAGKGLSQSPKTKICTVVSFIFYGLLLEKKAFGKHNAWLEGLAWVTGVQTPSLIRRC